MPNEILGIVLDMDGTLYRDPDYMRFQEDSQVRRLARRLGLSEEAAAARLKAAREARESAGLPPTSMGNLFVELGVDMESVIRWREEEIKPSEWLKPDPRLAEALMAVAERYRLILLTNNPGSVGAAALDALGLSEIVKDVVGLDATGRSKPAIEPFAEACRRLGLEASSCVSVGDRRDVDIEPALALGMGGILVDGVSDVYGLPEYLRSLRAD